MSFFAEYSEHIISKTSREKREKHRNRRKEDDELEDICRLMGLLSERDIDHTAVEVFRYALIKQGSFFGSTELSRVSRINRLTCLHHLKRMERMGIVENKAGEYCLARSSLEEIVEDFRGKSLMMFEEMMRFAEQIDIEMEREYGERQSKRAKSKAR